MRAHRSTTVTRSVICRVHMQCGKFCNRIWRQFQLRRVACNGSTRFARAFHQNFVTIEINLHPSFACHDLSQINWESPSVMQAKRIFCSDAWRFCCGAARGGFVKESDSSSERATEEFFFRTNDVGRFLCSRKNFWKGFSQSFNNRGNKFKNKWTIHAKSLSPMTRRSSNDATQNIISSFVSRASAIACRCGQASNMIGDHSVCDIDVIVQDAAIRSRSCHFVDCGKNRRPKIRVII